VIESLKKELSKGLSPHFYFYKTHDDHEVDLIIDRKTHKELIEIKASYSYTKRMISTMERLKEDQDTIALVYQGEDLSFAPVYNFRTFLK
jgi:predicted AAA+ superfamily ATPase